MSDQPRQIRRYNEQKHKEKQQIDVDRSCTEAVPDQRHRICLRSKLSSCRDFCHGRRRNTKWSAIYSTYFSEHSCAKERDNMIMGSPTKPNPKPMRVKMT
ncbi:hypothetical protein V6N13_043372 [Hibiscus sabdariffa]